MELAALIITASNTILLLILVARLREEEQLHHEIQFNSLFEDIESHEKIKNQLKVDRKKAPNRKAAVTKIPNLTSEAAESRPQARKKTATARKKVNSAANKSR